MDQDTGIARTNVLISAAPHSPAAELASLLGEERVSTEESKCAALAIDGKTPKCVVYPRSAAEVAAILKLAAERDFAVIPSRNATKLHIGNPPRRYDVALSLREMNRVWRYEPADLTIGVEPGMKLGDFDRFVARDRLWLPLDPAGGAKASIGGILATNASGSLRQAYGAPRDMALGLKIATIEGKLIQAGGHVVKNVAGYDMTRLLIGSFGTLAVIVEASFKLYPVPESRQTFALRVADFDLAGKLRRRILQSPLEPQRLVLLSAGALTVEAALEPFLSRAHIGTLAIEIAGSPRVIARCRETLADISRGAGVELETLPGDVAEDGWARVSDPRSWLEAAGGQLRLKALLPLTVTEEFTAKAQKQSAADGLKLMAASHIGVGTVYLAGPVDLPVEGLHSILERLRALATALGGSLVIEDCPAEIKGKIDVWGAASDDFATMRKIKQAWDPNGILSPGRFVGGL